LRVPEAVFIGILEPETKGEPDMLNLIVREMGGMPAPSSAPSLLDVLDRTLSPAWSWTPRPALTWPRLEVTHTDEAVVVTADVPGLGDDDLSITVSGRTLTIEGKTSRRGYPAEFQRQLTLAEGLDTERVEAQLDRGVLTVVVPKTPQAKPRQIKLGSGVLDKVKGLLGRQSTDSAD
jgi:HSP20 family molecular chaperone IbpA